MIAILITVIVGIPLGHALNVSQPYYVVATQGQVSLHCTYKTKTQPKEMQVSLFKGKYGQDRICSVYVNTSNPKMVTDGRMQCTVSVSKGRVDLTVFGLKGTDTDLYRCQVDVIFPPPYIKMYGNGTLVYIPEIPNCPTEHIQARIQDSPEASTVQTQNQLFPIILLYAILITTMITLILQLMKMILVLWKSNSNPQALSQKAGYINFW